MGLEALIFMQLGDVHAKLIAFFENPFATCGDEVVKAMGKASHAFAELIEAKVYRGKSVGWGWSGGAHCAGGERGLEER